MKSLTFYYTVFLLLMLCSNLVWAKKEGELPGLQNPGFVAQPLWFKSSFLDMREDIAEAADNKKRVIYYFYQDGCPYCKKLLTVNFAQKALMDKTRQNFDIVAVNMWGDRDVVDTQGNELTEKDLAAKLRVMFTPTLLFFDEAGQVALRVNGYFPPEKFNVALDYIIERQENNLRFSDYLKQKSPIASHTELHAQDYFLKPPYDLQKRSRDNGILIVLFEQKQCPACDELHTDILLRDETKKRIREFDVIQLDMWSDESLITPEGDKATALEFAKKLDVKYAPSFVFIDGSGKEIIRMEAYLKAFHIQSVMEYVSSKAYLNEPSFQRYIDVRANKLRDKGITVDLMN